MSEALLKLPSQHSRDLTEVQCEPFNVPTHSLQVVVEHVV